MRWDKMKSAKMKKIKYEQKQTKIVLVQIRQD